MIRLRKARTGKTPVRHLSVIIGAVAAFAAAPIFAAVPAHAAVAVKQGQSVDDFYDFNHGAPLWMEGSHASLAAQQLLSLLKTADADGLDPAKYGVDDIQDMLAKAATGNPGAIRKADLLLSKAFVAYARDVRDGPAAAMEFVYPDLRPSAPSPRALLNMAAIAPSLNQFIADMGWMNPMYAQLRRALVSKRYADERQRNLLRINMLRARDLPAGSLRYLVVNTATQRLYMYRDGKLDDSMKVVVGQDRDDRKTPVFASYVSYAALNPYWNVPPDLVGDDVAIHVLKQGLGYLTSRGYEVLSDWSDNATPVDPSTIDWQAVMDGKIEIRVRQNPGPHNVLGKVKFAIPNKYGVYLHDTAQRELLDKDIRLYSGGCIRLEDADRLGRWLFGHNLTATSADPEIKVPLDQPVPVYVTYLTAVPNGSSITFLDDVYDRDEKQMAELGISGSTGAKTGGR